MSKTPPLTLTDEYSSPKGRWRKFFIVLFVTLWTVLFHYESTRYFFLNPLLGCDLPKTKFLFPPAGWIMFYRVEDGYGGAEVYGFKDGRRELIDPHDILETKAVGYDNIHRNVLSQVCSLHEAQRFCSFLKRKFPQFDEFEVRATFYPSVVRFPRQKLYRTMYVCPQN